MDMIEYMDFFSIISAMKSRTVVSTRQAKPSKSGNRITYVLVPGYINGVEVESGGTPVSCFNIKFQPVSGDSFEVFRRFH